MIWRNIYIIAGALFARLIVYTFWGF